MVKPRVPAASGPIESLEPRRLLSTTYALDPTFGTGGIVYGAHFSAADVRLDGTIFATSTQDVRLHPDGTIAYENTPAGPVAVPTPPEQTKQPDGKYFAMTSGGLTRYNTSGTVDTTFGNNGTVSNIALSSPGQLFFMQQVELQGTKIFVLGYVKSITNGPDAVALLKPNGTLDPSYGNNGVAVASSHMFIDDWSVTPNGSVVLQGMTPSLDEDFPSAIVFSPQGVEDLSIEAPVAGFVFLSLLPDGSPLARTSDELSQSAQVSAPTFSFTVNVPFPVSWNASQIKAGADGRIFLQLYGADRTAIMCYRPTVTNTGAVSGRFFNDLNGNHKQDSNERGLAYWQAYADLNNNGVFDLGEPTTHADVFGNYTLRNLPAGTYHIREVRQNGWTRTTPTGNWPTGGVYNVTVAANKTVIGLNFGNKNTQSGKISGTVFNDANGDQIQNAGEAGLSNWRIYADLNNNGAFDTGEPSALSDTNGHYTLTLPPGGYRIREVRKSGWQRTTPPGDWPLGYYNVNLAPGISVSKQNFGNVFAASLLGTISGVAYQDTNKNGKRDPGEGPLVGVQIVLTPQFLDAPGPSTFQATTAADGSFSFKNLPAGQYVLGVSSHVDTNDDIDLPVTSNVVLTIVPSSHLKITVLAVPQ